MGSPQASPPGTRWAVGTPAPTCGSGAAGTTSLWVVSTQLPATGLDAGDVGGEVVDAVSVEVASGAVVVLGGARVGVPGEDLGVAQRYSGVEGVGDRCVPQRVWTDVAWDAGRRRDPPHHPIDVAAIDRIPGHRTQHQRSLGPLSTAGPVSYTHLTLP